MAGSDTLAHSGQIGAFSKGGLAEGTAAATIKTVNIVDFAIDGVAYRKAVTDNIAVTAHAAQAADTKALYLVQMDSAGVVSTKKGDEKLTTDVSLGQALQWPVPDADKAPIGGYRIVTVAVTFTNGTTDMSAAGVTTTFFDFIGGMPSAPQTS